MTIKFFLLSIIFFLLWTHFPDLPPPPPNLENRTYLGKSGKFKIPFKTPLPPSKSGKNMLTVIFWNCQPSDPPLPPLSGKFPDLTGFSLKKAALRNLRRIKKQTKKHYVYFFGKRTRLTQKNPASWYKAKIVSHQIHLNTHSRQEKSQFKLNYWQEGLNTLHEHVDMSSFYLLIIICRLCFIFGI